VGSVDNEHRAGWRSPPRAGIRHQRHALGFFAGGGTAPQGGSLRGAWVRGGAPGVCIRWRRVVVSCVAALGPPGLGGRAGMMRSASPVRPVPAEEKGDLPGPFFLFSGDPQRAESLGVFLCVIIMTCKGACRLVPCRR
jgi:hypothetical protein